VVAAVSSGGEVAKEELIAPVDKHSAQLVARTIATRSIQRLSYAAIVAYYLATAVGLMCL